MDITAAVVREGGKPFTIEKLELQAPRAGELIVEIKGVGLCHTDLTARDQILPAPLPAVFGHEGSGIVQAIGEGVTKVKVGDKVAVGFATCGTCPTCKDDDPSYCHNFAPLNYGGVQGDGAVTLNKDGEAVHGSFFGQSSFASYALTSERNVVPVGDDVPIELVGPLGCGLMTGAGAVVNSLKVTKGSTLLILGGGPVGLAAAMGGAIQEAGTIIVSEPVAARRELALELGATHAIDPTSGDIGELVRAIVPSGANFVVDTTGIPDVIAGSTAAVDFHATYGILAVPPALDILTPIPYLPLLALGLTVRGIQEGDSDPDVFIPKMLEWHKAGKFPFDKLIETFPLSQINEAVDAQHRGEVVKVVLVPDAA
ncbi:NAD(P)-dependent alcohol dehydrogenase [Patulibacter minatonensis]|uniref:NAD(P)-dependent alcohol dehydrogenase n=1 Tax=Patulibacter minatonensis TaxID=298163 RepID=UPI00047DD8F7|nr:NAD(P)-dependent alcohol dehydrogenase [Patulibacter minatonensis]